jgi:hypothetical protein
MTKPSSRVEFRPATAADAAAFYGQQPSHTLRGYVAVLEGKPVGIGGVFYEGDLIVAFSEMKDEYRKRKKDVARGIRLLIAMFDKLPVSVVAVANRNEPTASALLEKLGFVRSGTACPMGEMLIRERSCS